MLEMMNTSTTIVLAFGVAMDAFAVAVANGSTSQRVRHWEALRIAFIFGLFQMLMPLVGWALGYQFNHVIAAADHWIAFFLLAVIGGKMIYDDLTAESGENEKTRTKSLSIYSLLILAFATSIDALAIGLSLNFLSSITFQIAAIGIVTAALSLFGIYLGHRYRRFGQNKVKIIGGVILIGIGFKILTEHLSV